MNRSVRSRFFPLLISVLLCTLALPGAAFADDPVAIQGSAQASRSSPTATRWSASTLGCRSS